MKRMRLFPRLMLSFLGFALSIVIAMGVSLLLTGLFFLGDSTGNPLYVTADEAGNPINQEQVLRLGGWVEKLDSGGRITEVYGDKQNENTEYAGIQLAEITGIGESPSEYIGFLGKEQNGFRLLTLYPRKDINVQTALDISPGNTNAAWGKVAIGIFAVLFVLLMTVMSYFLVRQIRTPLAALTAGMEQVRRGEEGVHLEFTAAADVIEIRDTFNTMIRELEEQKKEKRLAEERRSRLLLELSHDIRTPIATVKSAAAALSEDLVPEKDRKRYYGIIAAKADRVGELSESLFSLLKIEDTDQLPVKETLDLSELLREVCGIYYNEIEASGLRLIPDFREGPVWFAGDPQLLYRAVGNLIENAIRYNRTGEEIRVSMREEGQWVRICVRDDGTPVPAEYRDRLFDAFARADRARATDGGTGLGLSIARTIVEKHGGSVSYQGDDGNLFCLDLPRQNE